MRLTYFPTEYIETVNGRETILPFHTDFRQWMRFEELITDSRVPEDTVIITALRMIFPEKLPQDISRAAFFMLWFYRCGSDTTNSDEGGSSILSTRRAYSFDNDFGMIAAAFTEKYAYDLWEIPYMHWWKFRALFTALHDCKFTDVCGYRNADLSEDMPDSRRSYLEQMQEHYALPPSANELRIMEAARRYLDG